jgi:hypothetical protein
MVAEARPAPTRLDARKPRRHDAGAMRTLTPDVASLALALSLAAACGSSSDPQPGPAASSRPPASSPPRDDGAAAAPAGELAWDAPASLREVDHPSSMRKATYQAPAVEPDTEAPELAVTVVGGSIDANVDRWVGQFDAAARGTLARTKRRVGPYEVTVVEMRGTFQGGGGMMGGPATPKPGWALLAAIVPAGERSWFFKMTGPEASVSAARADFDALVGSFRPRG